jgi:hypothetical protein
MDVDVHRAQAVTRSAGVLALLDEADDRTSLSAEIVDGDAFSAASSLGSAVASDLSRLSIAPVPTWIA